MTWFKVDDGLHSHRKAVRAGVPAMGLWVLAGSWSSDQLTDGWIPDYIAARLDPRDFQKHAAALVKAGLWCPGEHEGEQGWWFHQWEDHQPTAKAVHEKRDAAKDRMRRVREQRRGQSRSVRDPFDDGSREQVANEDGTSREVRLTPTRPDPTRSSYGTTKDTPPIAVTTALTLVPSVDTKPAAGGSRTQKPPRTKHTYDDPAFNRFWSAYPLKTGKPSALKAWRAAIKRGANPDSVIAAAEAYRNDRTRNAQFTKHPAPWLNDERYNDTPAEQPAAYAASAFWDN